MNRSCLSRAIAAALTGISLTTLTPLALAQQDQGECVDLQGSPPGLYVTVDQSQVYLIKDDKIVELNPGEAAYASETQLSCLKVPPQMLEWPCNTTEALSREMAPTYTLDELPAASGAQEVIRRYFEENQALSPQIEWLNGEYHGRFSAAELMGIDGSAYWYRPGSEDPFASPKRPRTQIVSLFWATGQAVVDQNTLTPLAETTEDGDVPVVFQFARDNQVPVSFFGPQPSLEQVSKAFLERGIELAPVPVWYAGDHHFEVSFEEMQRLFDLPSLDEISPERQQAIRSELEKYGFFHKPLTVSMLAENGSMVLDQPDVAVVAADMGFDGIPVVMSYFSGNSHLADCGISLPQVSVVGGATSAAEMTGATGITVPPQIAIPPQLPDPERNPSDS